MVKAIEKDNLPLPLVAINGEVKMAGGVDYYSIVSAIEALLKSPTAAAEKAQATA